MPTHKYAKPTFISLATSTELNEKWVQDKIADDPQILGLGPVVLKDRERSQPRAGPLDLLLQDKNSPRRYEVEITSAALTNHILFGQMNTGIWSENATRNTSTVQYLLRKM